jgi:dihydropteroate synthase
MIWRCRQKTFDLTRRTLVMGVVNITPDSFSDGSRFLEPRAAIAHTRRLIEEGADVIDFGAESTRPGAERVPSAEQKSRLLPVLEGLGRDREICFSVDTTSAEVAEAALAAGVEVVNDVSALGDPGMPGVVAAAGAGLVLMHMRGAPTTMQQHTDYEDVAREVRDWLAGRLELARGSGIPEACVAIDPGIGFAKNLEQNLELLGRIDELATIGRPVLVGASRKSFLGKLVDLPVDQRIEAGLGAAAIAVYLGARIVRTHDVAATVRAVRVAEALREARRGAQQPSRT